MKKIFLIFLICFLAYTNSKAMLVTIPEAETLKERFNESAFMHFIEKTDLIKQIAGEEISILGVFNAVTIALAQYEKILKDRPQIHMALKGGLYLEIIEIILKDSPEAFKQLKELIDGFEKD